VEYLRLRWARHVTRMGQIISSFRIFARNLLENVYLEDRKEDERINILVYLRE
jgi:hypothetical protein